MGENRERRKIRKGKVSVRNYTKFMRVKFYAINGRSCNCPRAMVAIGALPDGVFVRGIALCSMSEGSEQGFVENTGRDMARNRMLKAVNREISGDYIIRKEARKVLEELEFNLHTEKIIYIGGEGIPKSAFDVIPTNFEEKLLGFSTIVINKG